MDQPVTVIVGATSKWQPDGANTRFVHGGPVGEDLPVGSRWGLGGALAQRFALEGHHVVLTTRRRSNAEGLAAAIGDGGGSCSIVELDLGSTDSVRDAFASIRADAGDPDVLIYNAGYMAGRELAEEYPEYGVHVANVVVDGFVDSPGTRALSALRDRPDLLIDPVSIADAFHYLHRQDRSCWTHELQLTASTGPVAV